MKLLNLVCNEVQSTCRFPWIKLSMIISVPLASNHGFNVYKSLRRKSWDKPSTFYEQQVDREARTCIARFCSFFPIGALEVDGKIKSCNLSFMEKKLGGIAEFVFIALECNAKTGFRFLFHRDRKPPRVLRFCLAAAKIFYLWYGLLENNDYRFAWHIISFCQMRF